MPGTEADDEGDRPVPHPFDRPWIHPSELFATPRQATAGKPGTRSDRPTRHWRRDLALTVAAGTIGAVAAVAILGLAGVFEQDPARRVATAAPLASSTDAARIAAQVAPGIAAVITTVAGTERRGSGVAVGAHAVLTTADVLENAGAERADGVDTTATGTIEICLADGRRHVATEIGRDPITGLVLLDVPTLRVEPAALTDADEVRAGDWIIAVGRTATSGSWVTSGVVTAVGGWMSDDGGATHAGMITTSTGLAPEARGGALVDRYGNVVGILSVTGSAPTRTAAIPADMLRDVATQLATTGTASHGALGLRATDTSDRGATVTEITPGSSAATAGLRTGDRVIAVNSEPTSDTAALVYALRRRRAGIHITLTVVREKGTVRMAATLDDAATIASSLPPTAADTSLLAATSGGTG